MIKKPGVAQALEIQKLVSLASEKDQVLARSLNYIYENIRDFSIYLKGSKIIACCSLHVVGWNSLAEIKALVVDESFRGKGIGTRLVKKALSEAQSLGLNKVFALTFSPQFFKRLGFRAINKTKLPHKIWTECLNCKHFPDCKEEAVVINL